MARPPTSSAPKEETKKSSLQIVVVLLVSTLVGAAGGGSLGMLLGVEPPAVSSATETSAEAPAHAKSPAKEKHGDGDGKDAASRQRLRLKELPPVVTNLAAPETGWVRLQAAIVYDAEAIPQPDILVSEVTADVVAFLRTTTLASLEGADGLRRLHEDLSDRAAIRSEGRIREFIIQALVVQ